MRNIKKMLAVILAFACLMALMVCSADAASATPEKAAQTATATAEEEEPTSFEEAVEEMGDNRLQGLETMEVGDTIDEDYNGCHITAIMPQEGLRVFHVDMPEDALNKEIYDFTFVHGDGYLCVELFVAQDGDRTLLVSDLSEDGEALPIYITHFNNEETGTIDLDDLIAGISGEADLYVEEDEDGTVVRIQDLYTDDGELIESAYTYTEYFDDDTALSDTIIFKDGVAVATIEFTTDLGDPETQTLVITDEQATSILSYELNDGVIDLESVTVDAGDDYSAMVDAIVEDEIYLLNSLETDDEYEADLGGMKIVFTKVSDELLYTKMDVLGVATVEDFVYPHGDGYERLSYQYNNDDQSNGSLIVYEISEDGLTMDQVYELPLNSIDIAEAGEPVHVVIFDQTFDITGETTENDDGSVTVSIVMTDEEREAVISTDITITEEEDGATISTVATTEDGDELSLDFVIEGETRTVTLTDADGSYTLTYDRDDLGELITSSLNMIFG